ncbi:MAG TPA: ATP-binding protein [Stellaceae bacterium]|nr:ATP-binding protein [Stellaceae bacterium]
MGDGNEATIAVCADNEAMAQVRSFVENFGQARAVGAADLARVLIAVEELVTNIVRYGYGPGQQPGSVRVTLRLVGNRLSVEIVDDSRPFDPFAVPEPDLDAPIEARTIGGLGLYIVKALMDVTRYRRDGAHNVVEISRPVTLGN